MADSVKLVPCEPTREMWAAGGTAACQTQHQHHDAIVEAVWSAMLAASPPAREEAPAEGAGDFDGLEDHLAKLEASEVYAYESRIADLESEILTLRNRTSEPEAGAVARLERTGNRWIITWLVNSSGMENGALLYASSRQIDKLEGTRLNWVIGKGQLREEEPPFGCQILDGTTVVAEGEGASINDAIDQALAALNEQSQ